MTSAATSALVNALVASCGLPIPTPTEFAKRIEEQLKIRGFEIRQALDKRPPRIVGYPCTCRMGRGCLEHPFGPPRKKDEDGS